MKSFDVCWLPTPPSPLKDGYARRNVKAEEFCVEDGRLEFLIEGEAVAAFAAGAWFCVLEIREAKETEGETKP